MSDDQWAQRLQHLRDSLAPLSSEVPDLLENKGPDAEGAQQAYGTLDLLSEQAAILLDEMDDDDALADMVEACEDLQETIEEMRDSLSGKLARPKRRPSQPY